MNSQHVSHYTVFTVSARQALSAAQQAAAVEHSDTIDVRHLFMGLAQLPASISIAAHVLNGHGITPETFQTATPAAPNPQALLNLSHDVKKVLERATAIALERHDASLTSAHLLAGALAESTDLQISEMLGIPKDRLSSALYSLDSWVEA